MISIPTLALIGADSPSWVLPKLESLGFSVCILPHDDRLPRPVRSHPDMLIFNLGNKIFCSRKYYESNSDVFSLISSYGYEIEPSDATISNRYPDDIAFNFIYVNNRICGNIQHIAKEIIEYTKTINCSTVSVKQGYAKCSTVVLGNKAIITADSGIYNAAVDLGVEALKTENSPSISLPGYNYGFIGGACGVFKNTVYFIGNIDIHPFADIIKVFCKKHGYQVLSLSTMPLTDIGGVTFLPLLG